VIDGGDERRPLGPLPVADSREYLACQRDVGSDKACDLIQLHLEAIMPSAGPIAAAVCAALTAVKGTRRA
jgi:hypothetical protein